MKKQTQEQTERYCGNCYYHSVYSFPIRAFCMLRFQRREEPIVLTLSVCKDWKQDYQRCNCIPEALKENKEQKD